MREKRKGKISGEDPPPPRGEGYSGGRGMGKALPEVSPPPGRKRINKKIFAGH